MNEPVLKLEVDTREVDEAIRKVERLTELLKEADLALAKEVSEDDMKKHLQQLFVRLSEASVGCELDLLPQITKSMLDIYSLYRTIRL